MDIRYRLDEADYLAFFEYHNEHFVYIGPLQAFIIPRRKPPLEGDSEGFVAELRRRSTR